MRKLSNPCVYMRLLCVCLWVTILSMDAIRLIIYVVPDGRRRCWCRFYEGIIDLIYITVIGRIGIQGIAYAKTPVAGFTGNVTTGYWPLTVKFTDTSSNNPTSWSWNFGDKPTNIYVADSGNN